MATNGKKAHLSRNGHGRPAEVARPLVPDKRKAPPVLPAQKRSRSDLDSAVAKDHRNSKALASRHKAKRDQGDLEGALADIQAAAAQQPANISLILERGLRKLDLGYYQPAVADFKQVLRVIPDSASALEGKHTAKRQIQESPLRVITLGGFKRDCLNGDFQERRGSKYEIAGHETYWSAPDRQEPTFLFWCRRESRWKGGRQSDFESIVAGDRSCYIAAPTNANLLSNLFIAGWQEWYNKGWTMSPKNGVRRIGPASPPLRWVNLAGFSRSDLNTTFWERRQWQYSVNSRETYWSNDGQYFLFWSKGENRWKGSVSRKLAEIRGGRNSSFIGAPMEMDLLHPSLPKAWHEWVNQEWVMVQSAGVESVGPAPLKLRTVSLGDFQRKAMNATYRERRSVDSWVGGRETYWSGDGQYFLFWCTKDSRWKATVARYLKQVQAGRAMCYLGCPVKADLLSPILAKGWYEYTKAWNFRRQAGVQGIGCSDKVHTAARADFNYSAQACARLKKELATGKAKLTMVKKEQITRIKKKRAERPGGGAQASLLRAPKREAFA